MRRRTIIRQQQAAEQASQLELSPITVRSRRPRPLYKSLSPVRTSAYVGVFVLVLSLVAMSYQPILAENTALASAAPVSATRQTAATPSADGVDQLVATNVATSIAESTNLPVTNNVANLSQSIAAENSFTQTSATTINKPQIVQPTADNRTIKKYTTVAGDSVPSLADKFKISTQTIKWVNKLTSDALEPGKELTILPVNGILYTVKDGDTLDSIATKYKADKNQLTLYNDLELTSTPAKGSQLIIPDGSLPTEEQPGYVAPRSGAAARAASATTGTNSYNGTGAYGGAAGTAHAWTGGGDGGGYAWGNCTFYAYERRLELGRPIGRQWGNAATWASFARASGYGVGTTPAVGAVMQNGGGYGHVAIVESVNPGVSVTISEMNGFRWGGGFNRVGFGNIPWNEAVGGRYQYIY